MRIDTELEVVVSRPAPDVFAFLTDPANLPRWDPRVVAVEVLDGDELTAGSRIRETRKAGPRRVEQLVEVERLEPPRRFALRILEGPVPVHADFRLEDAMAGTRLVLRAHGDPSGPQLAAPLMRLATRRIMGGHLRRLKRVVEAEAQGPPVAPAADAPSP